MPAPSRERERQRERERDASGRQSSIFAKRVSGIYGQRTAGVTAPCSNDSGLALTASVDGTVTVNAELNSAEDVNL